MPSFLNKPVSMKILLKSLLLLFLSFSLSHAQSETRTCVVRGVVLDPNFRALYLVKVTDELRGEKMLIPIANDGSFAHELKAEHEEAYHLIFKEELDRRAFRPVLFFNDAEEVNIVLNTEEEWDNNSINGGKLNAKLKLHRAQSEQRFSEKLAPLEERIDFLYENDQYFSKEMKSLQESLRGDNTEKERTDLLVSMQDLRKEKLDLSPEARTIQDQIDEISLAQQKWKYQQIQREPSIMGYYLLYKDALRLERNKEMLSHIMKTQEILSARYRTHPYNALVQKMIDSYRRIKKGQDYRDFSAPDLEEVRHLLSDLKQDKVIVLDLWGSWCRPCLQKNRELKPIHKKYAGEDFDVIGVAREFKNTKAMIHTMEREEYPWFNLVELDDENEIWLKYNLALGGGGIFVIDSDGKILAVDPKIEEITEILEDLEIGIKK